MIDLVTSLDLMTAALTLIFLGKSVTEYLNNDEPAVNEKRSLYGQKVSRRLA